MENINIKALRVIIAVKRPNLRRAMYRGCTFLGLIGFYLRLPTEAT